MKKKSKTKVNKQGFEPDYKSSALSTELHTLAGFQRIDKNY